MKNIIPKIKRMLPILFMVGMALTLLPAMTLAAPGDYNTSDVAVINYIITNNNLSWAPANSDGSAIPAGDWLGVTWSAAATNKRIVELDITSCNLDGALDVSDLTALVELHCPYNNLTSLNVSGLTALTLLDCSYNNFTSLDVSGLTALTLLDCIYNNLTSLDVSGLTVLGGLYCHNNNLTSLDVSGTALVELYCYNNTLTSLDVSGLAALKNLRCYNNTLTSLDVSGTALELLYCYDNTLTSLDVSGLAALKDLRCSDNTLTSLDVSGTALELLYCYNNNLASLDVSGLITLEDLACYNNTLTSLNVSGLAALKDLRCSNNTLTSLDVSGTALELLYCSNNTLASLDVSSLAALETLGCDNNNLASLDVSSLTALKILVCNNNTLASLDVSGLANIIYLDVRYNLMPSESAVIDVTDAIAFTAWETGDFYFSPQKSKTGGGSTGTAKIISGSTPTPPLSQEDTLPVNTIVSVSNVTLDKNNATMKAGEILQLIATITPNNATNKGLNWSSSDSSVATVDANGRVTGLKDGTATITVTTSDGSFVASCAVTISGSVADTKTSIPGFAILTAMMGLLCAAVLFKWQQNQKKK